MQNLAVFLSSGPDYSIASVRNRSFVDVVEEESKRFGVFVGIIYEGRKLLRIPLGGGDKGRNILDPVLDAAIKALEKNCERSHRSFLWTCVLRLAMSQVKCEWHSSYCISVS
jgi:hypothetical protein